MVFYKRSEGTEKIEGREYVTYGIQAWEDDCLVCEVPYISPESEFVDNIIEQCMQYELEPVHLLDVVEDALIS